MELKFYLKKIFRKLKPDSKKEEQSLIKKWRILLIAIFLLLLAIVALDGYIFLNLKKDLEDVVFDESSVSKTVNQQALKNVVGYLEDREEQFSKNLLQPPQVFDPS